MWSRQSVRSPPLCGSVGATSAGIANATGTPAPPDATVRSSCQNTVSEVDRSRPLPVVTRRMPLNTTLNPLGGRRSEGVRTTPSSEWPTTAGSVASSSRETPYRRNRSVARTAHISSPMPTAGKSNTSSAARFCSTSAACTPAMAPGTLTRFHRAVNAHADHMSERAFCLYGGKRRTHMSRDRR